MIWALLVVVAAVGPAQAVESAIVVDGTQTSHEFDGHGGLSAGGTSRFLIESVLRFIANPPTGSSAHRRRHNYYATFMVAPTSPVPIEVSHLGLAQLLAAARPARTVASCLAPGTSPFPAPASSLSC